MIMTETLEEVAKKYYNNYDKRKVEFAFIDGAKWQQERSFTLEQIDELFIGNKGGYFDEFLDYRLGLNGNTPNKISFKVWFEQFKKK